MKNHFLKIILLTPTIMLTGCNIIQAGKITTIAGTYQLIKYEVTTHYVGSSMEELDKPVTVDVLKENNIVNYVTITSDNNNFGYYGYKDNLSSAYVQTMLQGYSYESEDSELIEEICLASWTTMYSFYVQARRKTLTNNSPAWKGTIHISGNEHAFGNNDKIIMKWKKVSKDQSLDYILNKLEVDSPLPYVETYF